MNPRKIALAIGLLFSSQLVSGKPNDLFSTQPQNFNEPGQLLPQNNDLDGFLNLTAFPEPLATSEQKKAYVDTLKLLKNKQLKDAEKKINSLIKQYPNDAEFYNLRALLGSYKNDNTLAIHSYEKALKLDPNNLSASLGLSLHNIVAGDYKNAQKYANKALIINDKTIYAYFLLADIAQKENREHDIEAYLLTAMNKAQGNIKQEIAVANKLGIYYISQNQPEKLLALAESINKQHPNNIQTLSFLASAQILNKKIQLSIQTLEKLVHLHPQDVPHRLILANILTKQAKNEKQALKLVNEAIVIDPDNERAHILKSTLLTQQKSYTVAFKQANKVRQITPDSGKAELLEGDIYLAQNELDKALASYQKSYQIKSNGKVANQIIKIMISQGNRQDAINFLKQQLKQKPDNLDLHFQLATLYEQQNSPGKAEKHYQYILSKQPDNVLVLNNLAWLYYLQDNPKALELAEKAYSKAPNSYAVADTYGVILVKQGELKKAIEILQLASKKAPMVYDIQYHLANAYALNGDRDKALKILNTLVKSEQDFAEKQSAISLLEKLSSN